jgi:hypothetical protein
MIGSGQVVMPFTEDAGATCPGLVILRMITSVIGVVALQGTGLTNKTSLEAG